MIKNSHRLFGFIIVASFALIHAAFADDLSNVTLRAVKIAKAGLLRNTASVPDVAGQAPNREFLLAGAHQYHSLWAWDFSFASMGALKAGQFQTVHDSLEIYFSSQRADGVLPRVIDNKSITMRMIMGTIGLIQKFTNPLKASFETENKVLSPIPNAILPWAASRYILYTQDRAFAVKWFDTAEKAIGWLESNMLVDGLIGKQPPYSDWEDSVQRTGKVAFTNEIYALALRGLSDWAAFLGDHEKEIYYLAKYSSFMEKFRAFFWMPERNAIRNFEGDDHLTADANLIAVAYHLVSDEDSIAIMKTLRASPLWQPMPGRPTWPNYVSSMKSLLPKFTGMGGYHDKIYWLWLTSLAVMAERSVGNIEGANQILEKLSHQITSNGVVHEVFDLKRGGYLKPSRRLLYYSEHPFTWSSGMFLESAL